MIWNYTVTVCGLASPRATAPNTTVGVKPRAARGSTLHPTADRPVQQKAGDKTPSDSHERHTKKVWIHRERAAAGLPGGRMGANRLMGGQE